MKSSSGTQRYQGSRNIHPVERWASLIGGGALLAYGLTRGGRAGVAMAALSVPLVQRGATGHCYLYQAIGVHTDRRQGHNLGVPYELGVRVDESITIARPAAELYRYWRNLENLPRFMKHLQGVKVLDDRRSRWVVRGPGRRTLEWDAEIINDVENRLIAWRSIPETSDVDSGGSVHFEPAPQDRGTEVRVSLQYNPPGGEIGAFLAKLFGHDPAAHVGADLRRFKQLMETGEIAAVRGQPSVRRHGKEAEPGSSQLEKGWSRDNVLEASEESFPASDPPAWTGVSS